MQNYNDSTFACKFDGPLKFAEIADNTYTQSSLQTVPGTNYVQTSNGQLMESDYARYPQLTQECFDFRSQAQLQRAPPFALKLQNFGANQFHNVPGGSSIYNQNYSANATKEINNDIKNLHGLQGEKNQTDLQAFISSIDISESESERNCVFDPTGQNCPPGGHPKVTTTLWEDEGTLCFQVEAKGICVARREDNDMINGTKLFNLAGISRGKRDGLLKNEPHRLVIKMGAMHLKGVWIPYHRALDFANQQKITDILYPLFYKNILMFLYHPENLRRTQALFFAVAKNKKKGLDAQKPMLLANSNEQTQSDHRYDKSSFDYLSADQKSLPAQHQMYSTNSINNSFAEYSHGKNMKPENIHTKHQKYTSFLNKHNKQSIKSVPRKYMSERQTHQRMNSTSALEEGMDSYSIIDDDKDDKPASAIYQNELSTRILTPQRKRPLLFEEYFNTHNPDYGSKKTRCFPLSARLPEKELFFDPSILYSPPASAPILLDHSSD